MLKAACGFINKKVLVRSAAVFFMLAVLQLISCSGKKSEVQVIKPPVPVIAGIVEKKTIPVQISVIGNVEAYSSVGVKAQVGGLLTKVHFTEGQDLNKGDLLFTIDPKPYDAALKQAEAVLAKDRAQFENARAEERRYAELVKKGYVSQTQYEQVRTNADALDAVMRAGMANVDNARLQLEYCTIRSPFSGRTGSLMVYEGNLIKANADTPMVTINQIQPARVSFSLPEKNMPDLKKYMSVGALQVEAFISKDDKNPVKGKLTFIDNAVDSATGTIKLKGTFDNKDRRLWPGQFVNVALTLTVLKDALVIPSQAVQTGQTGQFVFVVKDDLTAEVRPVVVSSASGGEAVIGSGLKSGEKIVIEGQMQLAPGAKVEIKSGPESKTEPKKEPKNEEAQKDKPAKENKK